MNVRRIKPLSDNICPPFFCPIFSAPPRISVKEHGEDVIFLRKIIPGGADRSYGIEVAKLAGLPKQVVDNARIILEELEQQAGKPQRPVISEDDQVSLEALGESAVIDALRRTQVDTLSPLEALNLLYEWKQKLQ